MNEEQAAAIAEAIGGDAWNSGGGVWLVRKLRADGRLVIVSEEVVCEFETEEKFDANDPAASIMLC